MKKLQSILSLGIALAALCLAAPPAEAANTVFSGQGSAYSTNTSYYVVSAGPQIPQESIPQIEYLNVQSDTLSVSNARGAVLFYRAGAPSELSAASGGATNTVRLASGGTAFTVGGVVILQHVAADTYERLVVMTNSATSVSFTNATASAVDLGDRIYLATVAASLPVNTTVPAAGAGNKEFAPPKPLFSGEEARPLLVEVNGIGTNFIKIGTISGSYKRE